MRLPALPLVDLSEHKRLKYIFLKLFEQNFKIYHLVGRMDSDIGAVVVLPGVLVTPTPGLKMFCEIELSNSEVIRT